MTPSTISGVLAAVASGAIRLMSDQELGMAASLVCESLDREVTPELARADAVLTDEIADRLERERAFQEDSFIANVLTLA
jgi:hypothetical protein